MPDPADGQSACTRNHDHAHFEFHPSAGPTTPPYRKESGFDLSSGERRFKKNAAISGRAVEAEESNVW
jgi:hypothetical protein